MKHVPSTNNGTNKPREKINEIILLLVESVLLDMKLADDPEPIVIEELNRFLTRISNSGIKKDGKLTPADFVHTLRESDKPVHLECDAMANRWMLVMNYDHIFTDRLEAINGWYMLSVPVRDVQLVFSADTFRRIP